jgi:hypothetical protein
MMECWPMLWKAECEPIAQQEEQLRDVIAQVGSISSTAGSLKYDLDELEDNVDDRNHHSNEHCGKGIEGLWR